MLLSCWDLNTREATASTATEMINRYTCITDGYATHQPFPLYFDKLIRFCNHDQPVGYVIFSCNYMSLQVSEAEDEVKFYKKRLSERFYGTVDSGYSNDESYFQPYSLSCFSFRRKSLKKYARDLVRWILSRQEQWTEELRKANTGFLYPIDIRHPRTSAPPLAKRPSYIPKKGQWNSVYRET